MSLNLGELNLNKYLQEIKQCFRKRRTYCFLWQKSCCCIDP